MCRCEYSRGVSGSLLGILRDSDYSWVSLGAWILKNGNQEQHGSIMGQLSYINTNQMKKKHAESIRIL